jgi:hypothetical protein
MTFATKRTGLITAVAGLVGLGACSNKSRPMDDALKSDLSAAGGSASAIELAPTGARNQTVVSAIEGGPTAAPKRAAPAKVPQPSRKATARVAQREAPAPQRAAVPAPQQAPVRAEPVIEAPAPQPAPAPAPAPQQDKRVYKTEAEIFRQMPWIKP